MTTRDEYVEKLKRQLDEWNEDIARLEAKLAELTGPARERLEPYLAKAREGRDAAVRKLAERASRAGTEADLSRKAKTRGLHRRALTLTPAARGPSNPCGASSSDGSRRRVTSPGTRTTQVRIPSGTLVSQGMRFPGEDWLARRRGNSRMGP